MSELAAAGAALYASPVQTTHQEEAENMTNQELEKEANLVQTNNLFSKGNPAA